MASSAIKRLEKRKSQTSHSLKFLGKKIDLNFVA